MDPIEMISKSCDFYSAESERLIEKLKACKSKKQMAKVLNEIQGLKQKISYEISQIEKLEKNGGESFY